MSFSGEHSWNKLAANSFKLSLNGIVAVENHSQKLAVIYDLPCKRIPITRKGGEQHDNKNFCDGTFANKRALPQMLILDVKVSHHRTKESLGENSRIS